MIFLPFIEICTGMTSYIEQKKRRIEKISERYDHVPTKKDVVLMLIGEENIVQQADPLLDQVQLNIGTSKKGCQKHTIRWRKSGGWTNPYSSLKTISGGQVKGHEAMYNSY